MPTINPTKSTVVTPSTSNTVFWIIQIRLHRALTTGARSFQRDADRALVVVNIGLSNGVGRATNPFDGYIRSIHGRCHRRSASHVPVEAPIKSVSLRLTYLSNDPTPLQVTPEQFPTGLSFTPFNVTMTPRYVVVGENPKGSGNAPSPPTQQLVTKTVATVPVHLKSQRLTAQLGKSSGGVQLQLPLRPGFAPEPPPTIAFSVQPLPIDVKVLSDQAAVIVPGVPASVGVSSRRGRRYDFQHREADRCSSGVKVGLASGGEIEIGDGTTSAHITIDAAFDPFRWRRPRR